MYLSVSLKSSTRASIQRQSSMLWNEKKKQISDFSKTTWFFNMIKKANKNLVSASQFLILFIIFLFNSLREECPNAEFFLVRIWTLFTQSFGNSGIVLNNLSYIQPPVIWSWMNWQKSWGNKLKIFTECLIHILVISSNYQRIKFLRKCIQMNIAKLH